MAGSASLTAEPTPTAVRPVSADCGWGRVLFARTDDHEGVVAALLEERAGERDIAYDVHEPHVMVSLAPQDVFVDPSHTYRLPLAGAIAPVPDAMRIRPARADDETAINRIYAQRRMVELRPGYLDDVGDRADVLVLVASSSRDDEVLGVVVGVDHCAVFDDPANGSSLWSLAVDPHAAVPGVGRALVAALAREFERRGRAHMDLSVMHDNEEAVALYRGMGFEKVGVYCAKKKNPINEPLFIAPRPAVDGLNVYAEIIVTEARRRGIRVDVVDAQAGLFELTHGGRTIACRESLSDLTSAVAMSRCADKALTARLLTDAGIPVPEQASAGNDAAVQRLLERHAAVVVKPAVGEQGSGVHVDLRTPAEIATAVEDAAQYHDEVIVEQYLRGAELRVVVIGGEVVAAAERRPAQIVGDGRRDVKTLLEKQSRRRAAATGGESTIPLDAETRRCLERAGYTLADVPPAGEVIVVRHTANLHTGGTLHDVTAELSPALARAACAAAEALRVPVAGLDFIVSADDPAQFAVIEVNERPGLANHEPQPTAQRFVDLLFPETRSVGQDI
ncbi:MAG: N-acetylglutaminylglutamine synthetase [Gammaproteobacteria bacterium]